MPLDVAITGATGYPGRTLSATLLARGHQVRALAQAVENAPARRRILDVPQIRAA